MATYVDKVSITVESGHGGSGSSSFRREKYVPKGGPDGGDGGKGGDVIFEATPSLQTLMDLRFKQHYKAKGGEHGGTRLKYGKDGEDCVIPVPCGTMIFDLDGEKVADLTDKGARFIAARGGKGGRGNKQFASSVNRAPTYAQSGLPGEEGTFTLELRLLADVGLMGYPNAGKSTLLQTLTQANPKIASYPFTTLYPNLGVLKTVDKEVVIADIPGIIEGASEGKGLGHDFLRHLDRTRLVLHLVDASSADAQACFDCYQTLQEELAKSDYPILEKKQIMVLSKTDQITAEELQGIQEAFIARDISSLNCSSFTRAGIDDVIHAILQHT